MQTPRTAGSWVRLATLLSAVLTAVCLMIPEWSSHRDAPTAVTLAWAKQDQPSGVYIDRDFDWPTGEAVWIDIPIWAVQLAAIVVTAVLLRVHWRLASRGCAPQSPRL